MSGCEPIRKNTLRKAFVFSEPLIGEWHPFARRGIASFAMNKAGVALLGVAGSAGLWWAMDLKPCRAARLRRLLQQQPIQPFKPHNAPFLEQTPLVEALTKDILSQSGGVKVLWGAQGSGKTTAVHQALTALQEQGQISGAIFLTSDSMGARGPSAWLRQELRDWRGPLLAAHEHLSVLLPGTKDASKPFVLVIDNAHGAPYDEAMRVFIKTLAEDSLLCSSYIVLWSAGTPSRRP